MDAPTKLSNINKPFTRRLGNLMAGLVLCYFVTNVWIVESCKTRYLDLGQPTHSVCSVAEVFTPLRYVVPGIFRPVDVLLERNDSKRAELAEAVYGFNWGSFLIFGTLIALIGLVKKYSLSDEEIAETLKWRAHFSKQSALDKNHSEHVNLGKRIMIVAAAICFVSVFWGFYSFDEYSHFKNMVHERNRDLYLATVFLSILLLFEIYFVTAWLLEKISKSSGLTSKS